MTAPKTIKTIAVLVFAAETPLFFRWIPDDAYISFRYAENLAAGYGLVFNAGERVEGFSNLLWTLFLSAAARVGLDTVTTAILASSICALISVWLGLTLFETVLDGGSDSRAGERRRFLGIRTALGLGLVVSFPMIFYATSGLETHAELMCLLLGVVLHLRAHQRGNPFLHVPSMLAFLAAALLRPEGISFLLLNVGFVACGSRSVGLRRAGVVWLAAFASLSLYAVVYLLKAEYYQAFVPNTYMAKPGVSFSYFTPAFRGAFYLVRFFLKSGLITLLPFCLIALTDKKTRYAGVYLSAVVLGHLAFIVFVGGDVLRFDRFTVPFFPFLLTIALIGFVRLDALSRVRSRALSTWTAWFCVGLMVVLNGGRIYVAQQKYCLHDWMHARTHRQIGLLLAESLGPDASVVVNEVGAISYYSKLETIDMLGLTDATVARLVFDSYQRFGRSDSDWGTSKISAYLYSRRPTCVVVPSLGEIDPRRFAPAGDLMHPLWNAVYNHADLQRQYRCVLSVRVHERKYLHVFVLNEAKFEASPLALTPALDCMRIEAY